MSKKSKEGAYVGNLKFLSKGTNRTKEDFSAGQSKKRSHFESKNLARQSKKSFGIIHHAENKCATCKK